MSGLAWWIDNGITWVDWINLIGESGAVSIRYSSDVKEDCIGIYTSRACRVIKFNDGKIRGSVRNSSNDDLFFCDALDSFNIVVGDESPGRLNIEAKVCSWEIEQKTKLIWQGINFVVGCYVSVYGLGNFMTSNTTTPVKDGLSPSIEGLPEGGGSNKQKRRYIE